MAPSREAQACSLIQRPCSQPSAQHAALCGWEMLTCCRTPSPLSQLHTSLPMPPTPRSGCAVHRAVHGGAGQEPAVQGARHHAGPGVLLLHSRFLGWGPCGCSVCAASGGEEGVGGAGRRALGTGRELPLKASCVSKPAPNLCAALLLPLLLLLLQAPMPAHLAHLPYEELQFTMVDCPGGCKRGGGGGWGAGQPGRATHAAAYPQRGRGGNRLARTTRATLSLVRHTNEPRRACVPHPHHHRRRADHRHDGPGGGHHKGWVPVNPLAVAVLVVKN